MAKRIGLLSADGTPTELYQRLRDPAQSCAAVAASMKHGYPMLYAKHADLYERDRKVIAGLVAEFTGLEPGHASAPAIVGSFIALKKLASPRVEAERVAVRRVATERRTGRKSTSVAIVDCLARRIVRVGPLIKVSFRQTNSSIGAALQPFSA